MSFNTFPINKLVISSSAAGLELHTTVLSRFMIPFVTVYVFSLKCCNSMPNWLMSKNTDGVKIHLISSKERKNYIYRNVMRISIKNFWWKGVIMIGIFGSIILPKILNHPFSHPIRTYYTSIVSILIKFSKAN